MELAASSGGSRSPRCPGCWRSARVRVFAWLRLVATVLLCTQIVHLRYLVPALLGLGIAFTVLLARTWPRAGAGFVAVLVALNLVFAQGTSWKLREGIVLRYLLVAEGERQYLVDFAPERLLLAPLKESGQPFMVFGDDQQTRHAELSGRGVIGNGYDPQTGARFDAAWPRTRAPAGNACSPTTVPPMHWRIATAAIRATSPHSTTSARLPPRSTTRACIGCRRRRVPVIALADAPSIEREIQRAGRRDVRNLVPRRCALRRHRRWCGVGHAPVLR